MAKKKIVHIVPSFGQGGVQTGILYSLEDLNKVYDYKVLVITKMDNVCKEWIKDLSPQVRSYIIDTGASGMINGWIKGYAMLKQLQPDLIISSLWKSVGLSTTFKLFNKRVKLAGFFHTSYTPHAPYFFFMTLLVYFQDTCFADSEVTSKYIEKVYKIRQAHIIPYLFAFQKSGSHNNFDPNKIRMVYFGVISEVKRVDRALAFCRLCKLAGINFIFDLYARGNTVEYSKKIEKLGLQNEVVIKGIVPLNQVIGLMQQYDFLLQLSDHEGMALSVVEALNCGLVPIVTPVGEIARYSKDEENAIWLDYPFDDNLPQLFTKLQKVLSTPDRYQQLSTAAEGTFAQYKKYSEAMVLSVNQSLEKK